MRPTMRAPMTLAVAVAALVLMLGTSATAQYTPIWFDGYQSPATLDINAGIGAPRQGGSPVPLEYVQNLGGTADPNLAGADDYHQQIIGDPNGVALLQLAGDGNINIPPAPVPPTFDPDQQIFHSYVSPNNNFNQVVGNQTVKKISVVIDTFTNSGAYDPGDPNVGGDGYFTTAAITIGSTEPLTDSDNLTTSGNEGFSVKFLEQTFVDSLWTDPNIGINFLQFRDDQQTASNPPPAFDNTVGNLIKNPAGENAPAFVEIYIDDATDGNPWDGIGQTDISVDVNGINVFNYTKFGGGFTDNFITLQAMNQSNFTQNSLAIHTFDNLTVFNAPIPEPTTCVLLGMGVLGLAVRRQRVA